MEALRLYAADVKDPLRMEFNCDVEHQDFQNFTVSPIAPMDKTLYFDSDVLKLILQEKLSSCWRVRFRR